MRQRIMTRLVLFRQAKRIAPSGRFFQNIDQMAGRFLSVGFSWSEKWKN